ncbi:DUF6297 family protein [Luteimicrobium sp. DT211]|uniref:DUF6297 family protein n=1 Tax=Luteimicrobium sp. DT211 TaxID=3393412 RepID=UPI003CEFFB46
MTDDDAPRPLPRPRTDADASVSGRRLRLLTARTTAAHSPRSPEPLTDVLFAAISCLLTVGLVSAVVRGLRQAVSPGADGTWGAGLLQGLGLVALVLAGASLALRLGPVVTTTAQLTWWFPTPVERRGLLATPAWRALAIGIVGGAAGAAGVAAVVGASTGPLVATGALGAAGGLLVVAGAGLIQGTGSAPRATLALDIALAALPVVAAMLGTLGGHDEAWSPTFVVTWALGALGVVGACLWAGRIGRLGVPELRRTAAATTRAWSSLLSMDARGLASAVELTPGRARRRRSRRLRVVRGPASALVTADAALLLAGPAPLARLVGIAGLAVVAEHTGALGRGAGLYAVLALTGYAAAHVAAAGARVADERPALERLLPMGARAARGVKAVVPAVSAVVALAVAAAREPGLLPTALVAGLALGAAAVRAAYRKPPNWSAPLLASPAGGIPAGYVAHVLTGPDCALLGTLPLLGAAATGPTPAWLGAQVVVALGALWWATRP